MKYYILNKNNVFSYVIEQNPNDFKRVMHLLNYSIYEPPTLEPDTWRWVGGDWIKIIKPKPILGFIKLNNNLTYNTVKSEYTGELSSYEGDRRLSNVPS